MAAMMHLLRYVKGTQDFVLELGGGETGVDDKEVTVLADANWADGPTRRSTSGGCVYYLNHEALADSPP
eukprot:7927391-Heterocapsa_arctica.AAC.1